MTQRPRRRILQRPKSQRGTGLFATVLLLALGALTATLTLFIQTPAAPMDRDPTGDALAAVKHALVGYAARRGLPAGCTGSTAACAAALQERPGELPCPDTNNDGVAEATCATTRIGRVPWKTLGIPEPRDEAGETLWYAVSRPFLDVRSNPITVNGGGTVTGGLINSSTLGDIEIRAADGTSVVTTQAVAVIFSPGQAINGQNRSTRVQDKRPCIAGEADEFRHLCRANYLESTSGVTNATLTGPYIVGLPSRTFNDRVIYLTAADIIPMVEMRVGTELKNLLLAYRQGSKCRCYPWADSWEYSGGIPDVGINRGRFPAYQVTPVNWGVNDSENKIPELPSWVTLNDWHNMVYYSAARQETDEAGRNCFFCTSSPTLTVQSEDGTTSQAVSALIITPGLPRNGRLPNAPPSELIKSSNHAAANDMRGYFDDDKNYNKYAPGVSTCPGWDQENAGSVPDPANRPSSVAAKCDTYVRPSSRASDRDRLYTVQTESGSHCATAARTLLKVAPCINVLGIISNPLCTTLNASLQSCECKVAATAILQLPCLDILGSACKATVTQLNTCLK